MPFDMSYHDNWELCYNTGPLASASLLHLLLLIEVTYLPIAPFVLPLFHLKFVFSCADNC